MCERELIHFLWAWSFTRNIIDACDMCYQVHKKYLLFQIGLVPSHPILLTRMYFVESNVIHFVYKLLVNVKKHIFNVRLEVKQGVNLCFLHKIEHNLYCMSSISQWWFNEVFEHHMLWFDDYLSFCLQISIASTQQKKSSNCSFDKIYASFWPVFLQISTVKKIDLMPNIYINI